MRKKRFLCTLMAVVLSGAAVPAVSSQSPAGSSDEVRPCDIYKTGNTPCVAAHSTTRSLYAAYRGPLYQVRRKSDGRTMDIGVKQGFADATVQDLFCRRSICVISIIYDQSGKGNHLTQAPPGTFKGPATGAFDELPIADMAPITIHGHKAYGVYIMPGMGFRNNDARSLAVNDEAEGIYYVIDGTHFDSGCCFDYGNSSTNGKAVGTGTMETTYFGTSTVWGRGAGPGPWIMSDMEAGLFSGRDAKLNAADPTIDSWRFTTAVMDGDKGDLWDLRGGDAQRGPLKTFYRGPRPLPGSTGGYAPMRKQGGILLGTGGDNGNGSSGTFYEGVMTQGFPSEATTDAVQANIVSAKYDVARLSLSPVKTFRPGTSQKVTVTFTNTTGKAINGLQLQLDVPKEWRSTSESSQKTLQQWKQQIQPGATVQAVFNLASPKAVSGGFLVAEAEWSGGAKDSIETRIRNAPPVSINEVAFGNSTSPANQFVELYNASDLPVDISGWSILHTPGQWSTRKLTVIPGSKQIAAKSFYLLGLSPSGLAAASSAGATTIHLRDTAGLAAGQTIVIDGEERKITNVGSQAGAMTTIFIPVSTAPSMELPAGSTKIPVTNAEGFYAGDRVALDLGGRYEIVSLAAAGRAGTQTVLTDSAKAGDEKIYLAQAANILKGDTLTIGTGTLKEFARVKSVGEPQKDKTQVELVAPLHFDHAAQIDVSDTGTGLTLSSPTKFAHTSGQSVQPLGSGVSLDKPLSANHLYGAPVSTASMQGGYRGQKMPDQWFGGSLSTPTATPNPAGPLSNNTGSFVLMDATGSVVVDALVYGTQQSNSSGNGTITSPELAVLEGEQAQGGCIAIFPAPINGPGSSLGRFPDGADLDSNCHDFHTQTAAGLAASSAVGAHNLKVDSVAGFVAGQTLLVGQGDETESVVVSEVGTSGGTTSRAALSKGAKVIPVQSGMGFVPGQTIVVGDGASSEECKVVSVSRRGEIAITITNPLNGSYGAGTKVAGTGITLRSGLQRAHRQRDPVLSDVPTPGGPNRYPERR